MKPGIILVLEITIHLDQAQSIKEKRNLRRSIVDRLRQRYNVSVMEVGFLDVIKTLQLTLAYVALNESKARFMLDTLTNEIEILCSNHQAQLSLDFHFL